MLMDVGRKASYRNKIKSVEELKALAGPRPRAQSVVMCHGTFDIVHPGHMRHLMFAKDKADILIVSLTCDDHVKKANVRPYVTQDLRALNLAAFEMVDYVLIDHEPTPLKTIAALQPDYFVKGFEYAKSGLQTKTKEELELLESYGGELLFSPGDVVYSSSALIEMSPPNLAVETLLTTMRMEGIGFDDLRRALDQIEGTRVHVVGDSIVDTLTHCTLIGGLTKTPTFSVQVQSKQDFVGGAAIVAKHLRAAGASVTFSTLLGNDAHGLLVMDELTACGITVNAQIELSRPTTNKNAIVTGGYRLLKLDTVDNRSISPKTAQALADSIRDTDAEVVVFSDFRHGMFNRDTIPQLQEAIPSGTFTAADSQVASRWGNILEFKAFDLITPNEREARFALGDQDSVIRPLAARLYEAAQCKSMILKLGERGALVRRNGEGSDHAFHAVGTFADRVVDAVGTGDALLAYATLTRKTTGSDLMAAILGSFAAAIECEHDGNVPVEPDSVRRKIDSVERQANGR